MRTGHKKALQRTLASRVWATVGPFVVLGFAIALGVLAGTFVGGSIGFTVGSMTAATALLLLSAGVLWIEARATHNSTVMQELTSVNWLQLIGRFWLAATVLVGLFYLVNTMFFGVLDELCMNVLMLLEALIAYVLVRRYGAVFGSWVVQKAPAPDED